MDVPVPRNGSNTQSPSLDKARNQPRQSNSTGNWHGWPVFSTWFAFHVGIVQRLQDFFRAGLHEYWPAFGPFEHIFFPGIFLAARGWDPIQIRNHLPCKPHDCFITPGEAARAVKAMPQNARRCDSASFKPKSAKWDTEANQAE